MTRALFGFLAFVSVAGPAAAAPQILGLVATGEAVPMQCAGAQCVALLSAFCLQKNRLPPDFETLYQPARPDTVTLVVTATDGRQQRFEAAGLVQFRSRYGYTAVRADLSLAALGTDATASVAIEVAPRAAMLPGLSPGDPNPLTAPEIALATGPARLLAETIFEAGSEPARTTGAIARIINALPLHGDIDAAAREGLWRRVAGAESPRQARDMFEACTRTIDQSLGYPLRLCLEERHQRLQVELTHELWESLGGS